MNNIINNDLDEWEKNLEQMLIKLKECQNTKQFSSCSSCSEFFECNLRKSYIQTVYKSMNKDAIGGFEF